ncbi:MAG: hypothetical protein HYS60_00505 [Candidatus Wildermuthbacteria bacterium]|nr:hypothetical protein [Candidatus Wildermuthbacteria bacterium]
MNEDSDIKKRLRRFYESVRTDFLPIAIRDLGLPPDTTLEELLERMVSSLEDLNKEAEKILGKSPAEFKEPAEILKKISDELGQNE